MGRAWEGLIGEAGEALDGGHDQAHTGEQGAVVDGAGGSEDETALYLGGVEIAEELDDDDDFLVAAEGEGGELGVDNGSGAGQVGAGAVVFGAVERGDHGNIIAKRAVMREGAEET